MQLVTPLWIFLIVTLNLTGQSPPESAYSIGEKHTLYSKILKENREVFVHVPKGFWGMDEELRMAPVAIVLDGESQFLHTVAAIDFLSSAALGNDKMPRTIVVGIPNTNRNRDLTPVKGVIGKDSASLAITGGGGKFLEFITSELFPYIDSLYSTSQHRTIIGHSLGGLIVFEALLRYRASFNNYLAIDPALHYDNGSYFAQLMDTLRSANLKEENLFVAKANSFPSFLTIASIQEDTSEVVKITKANHQFLELANAENWSIHYSFQDFPQENHFSVPYRATYIGMQFFYAYYPFPEIIDYYHPSFRKESDLVDRMKKHYQSISKELGFEAVPMESYINTWAHGFAYFDRKDLAIDLFDYNIELYPDHPSVYNAKGFFLLNQDRKTEAIKLFETSLSIREDAVIRKKLEDLKSTKK